MIEDLIFEAVVGSVAYGTNVETSDLDKKGVFLCPIDDLITFGYTEQINVTKDETYYEVRRFLELCSVGNPTCLELIFSDDECILKTSPQFELIRENREKFITKKCANAFTSYGYSQISKANSLGKKLNYNENDYKLKTPLDFIYFYNNGKTYSFKDYMNDNGLLQEKCGLVRLEHMKDCYAVYYDYDNNGYRGIIGENSNEVRLSSIKKGETPFMMIYYNVEAYSKFMKEWKEYNDWLKNRNTQRYVDVKKHGQTLSGSFIDGKNLLHCRRLIDVGVSIASTGTFTVKRPNVDYLLQIKRGEVPLDKIISDAERDIASLKDLYDKSNLPDCVDPAFVKELLLKIRKM